MSREHTTRKWQLLDAGYRNNGGLSAYEAEEWNCNLQPLREAHQPPAARRVAVPWRAGQTSVSKVRLRVSPVNRPVILEGCACLDRRKSAAAVPERLPSGISAKFCIGTVVRAWETVPDKRPCAFVIRTSHSPQRREPAMRVPCTVQTPSASWARTGELAKTHALPAMRRKDKDLRNMRRPLRSMIPTSSARSATLS